MIILIVRMDDVFDQTKGNEQSGRVAIRANPIRRIYLGPGKARSKCEKRLGA